MKIILISGKKRSGKDYIASELKETFEKNNQTCEIIHFADPIKEILCKSLNISRDELEIYKDKESEIIVKTKLKNKKYECASILNFRKLLQQFGTDAMQNIFGKEVWKNLILKQIKKLNCDFVIIPDFRFLHENIENSLTILIEGGKENDNHISENNLKNFNFDYIINNKEKDPLKIKNIVNNLVLKILGIDNE